MDESLVLERRSSWLPRVPTGRDTLRLFCFPYAGGAAAVYRDWQTEMPPYVEVCAVELPGRGGRFGERSYRDLRIAASDAAAAIAPHLGPRFAIFGHSMGALIAFETARALRRELGVSPEHLIVGGCRAPQFPRAPSRMHELPDAELVEELRLLGGTPEEVLQTPELLELVLPVVRADLAACAGYRYEPDTPLACPITALGGRRDIHVSTHALASWGDVTTGEASVRVLPGDHFFLHSHQDLTLRIVQTSLAGG